MDRQWGVLMEGYILQWIDNGGLLMEATSCSGQTVGVLMEGYILQWIDNGGY